MPAIHPASVLDNPQTCRKVGTKAGKAKTPISVKAWAEHNRRTIRPFMPMARRDGCEGEVKAGARNLRSVGVRADTNHWRPHCRARPDYGGRPSGASQAQTPLGLSQILLRSEAEFALMGPFSMPSLIKTEGR